MKWYNRKTHIICLNIFAECVCLFRAVLLQCVRQCLHPDPTLSRDVPVQINSKMLAGSHYFHEITLFVVFFLKITPLILVTHDAFLFWFSLLAGIKNGGWIHLYYNSDKWLPHTIYIKILYTYVNAAQVYCVKIMKTSILRNI